MATCKEAITTFEARPGPCGYRTVPARPCRCTVAQIRTAMATLPAAEITVETCLGSQRRPVRYGTTLADMRQQIARASSYRSTELDDIATGLLRQAATQMALDLAVENSIRQVARTIANLDQAERIATQHVAEAVNYRPLGR